MRKDMMFVGFVGLLLALPLQAQEEDDELPTDRGTAVAVGVGDGAALGLWQGVGERTDLGIEAAFSVTQLEGEDGLVRTRNRAASLGMSVKRFVQDEGASVVPYVTGGPILRYARTRGAGAFETEQWELGARGGVGLDWFLSRRVSVGGHVGVEAMYRAETRLTMNPLLEPDPQEDRYTGFSFRTVSSGVRVRLAFR